MLGTSYSTKKLNSNGSTCIVFGSITVPNIFQIPENDGMFRTKNFLDPTRPQYPKGVVKGFIRTLCRPRNLLNLAKRCYNAKFCPKFWNLVCSITRKPTLCRGGYRPSVNQKATPFRKVRMYAFFYLLSDSHIPDSVSHYIHLHTTYSSTSMVRSSPAHKTTCNHEDEGIG